MIYVRNRRTWKGFWGTYIGRGSPLNNPFVMESEADRDRVIQQYRRWLWEKITSTEDNEVLKEIHRLVDIAKKKDLYLVCWCAPKACHGDVVKACIEWMLKEEAK